MSGRRQALRSHCWNTTLYLFEA